MIVLFQSLSTAVAYLYFHWRYFALSTAMLKRPAMPGLHMVGTSLLNYSLFFFCSIFELNLIVNWMMFFLFLLCETLFYCKSGWRIALFLSLSGVISSLSVNISCRCVVAVIINKPLSAFDNNVNSVGNLKFVPVMLAFLLGGLILHLMSRPRVLAWLFTLVAHPEHIAFQLELMGVLLVYLSLNLLLYQSEGNNTTLKLWGLKSCIFSIMGVGLGLRYSLNMCRLSEYRAKNRAIQRELAQSEQREALLRTVAYRDALTGAYNWQYTLEQLQALVAQHARFTLCFLDLDGLKEVNDRWGHAEGDRYLTAVAGELARACREDNDILARYGGDEFVLLMRDVSAQTMMERLRQANLHLNSLGGGQAYPFPMSVSYGVVEAGGADSAEALLSAADKAMYRMKRARNGA